MQIHKVKTEKTYSLISIEEHLDLLRSKFDLVLDVEGHAEPQAVAESLTMKAHSLLTADLSEDKMLVDMSMLYRQAHNYMELLIQLKFQREEDKKTAEKEEKQRKYEDHAKGLLG